jgi:Domain of unknown function (DUF4129)
MRLNPVDREWKWIDDGVLPYALAALRALWVALALHLYARVTGFHGDLISLPVVFLLLAGSTALAQYGALRARNMTWFGLLLALIGVWAMILTLYLALGWGEFALWDFRWLNALTANPLATFLVAVAAIWLWRWGMLTGREPLRYGTLSRNFALGIAALALELAVAYGARLEAVGALLLPALAFFAIGLGALALSSLQTARRYERTRIGESFALNRYWLGTVGGVIVLLLLAGLLIAGLVAPDEIARSLSGVTLLLDALARLLLLVAFVISYAVFAVFEFLGRYIHLAPPSQNPPALPTPPSFADLFKNVQERPAQVSPEVYLILQIGAALLLAVIALWIFTRAFRRFRTYAEEDVEESRESILSADLLKGQLAKLFARRGQAHGAEVQPFVKITGEDPRDRVRRTYQALLGWAAARGVPRSPGMTPNEYSQLMNRALHLYIEPIWIITEAYLAARYSAAPVSMETAEQAAQAWEQIARENGKKQ